MTPRALSAWFAIGSSVLAILVAVDRPHWFGLQPGTITKATRAATAPQRSAPWLIKRAAKPVR